MNSIRGSEGMNNSSSMNTPCVKEDIQVLYLELVKLPHLQSAAKEIHFDGVPNQDIIYVTMLCSLVMYPGMSLN